MKCPLCEHELPEDAIECSSCGNTELSPCADIYRQEGGEPSTPLVAEPVCSMKKEKEGSSKAIELLNKLREYKQQKKWGDILSRREEVLRMSELLENSSDSLIAKELDELLVFAKTAQAEIKLYTSVLEQSRIAKDDVSFLKAADVLRKWDSLDAELEQEVLAVKNRLEKSVEKLAPVIPPPASGRKRKVSRKTLIPLICLGVLLLLVVGTYWGLGFSRAKGFVDALATRNIEKAKALSEQLGERRAPKQKVDLLSLVVSKQKEVSQQFSEIKPLLSEYFPNVYQDIRSLLKIADEERNLTDALHQYIQAEVQLTEVREQTSKLSKIQKAWTAMTSGPTGATLLNQYFPEKWADISSSVEEAKQQKNLKDAEDAWLSVWKTTQSLRNECAEKLLAKRSALSSKDAWKSRLSQLTPKQVSAMKELKEKRPEEVEQITLLEKKAVESIDHYNFTEAEKIYKELPLVLGQTLSAAEKFVAEKNYQSDLKQAVQFIKEMEWAAALKALDDADASGYSDRSRSKNLREEIESQLVDVEDARRAYEQHLEKIDKALYQKNFPKQWKEILSEVEKARIEKDPSVAANSYDKATGQLVDIIQKMEAFESKQKDAPKLNERWVVMLNDDIRLELLPVSAGEFLMGTDQGNDYEGPRHLVTLKEPFWLGRVEVTLRQVSVFLRESDCKFEQGFDWQSFPLEKNNFELAQNKFGFSWEQPANFIDWNMAVKFCKWLTDREHAEGRLSSEYHYSLPTESQWEYACRAGTTGDYPQAIQELGWHKENSAGHTHKVGEKAPNAWGFYDMHGNVAEWTLDHWHDDFYGAPADGSAWGSFGTDYRVVRGGSFNNSEEYCTSSSRAKIAHNVASSLRGFRVALVKSSLP